MPSRAEQLAALPKEQRDAILAKLTPAQLIDLRYDWRFWARPTQLPPAGDWTIWLYLAGRGAGKTRSGGEWCRSLIANGYDRLGLIAPTAADVRDVLVEGESGLLACCPPGAGPIYEPSKRRLTWPSGQTAYLYSAEEPDRLRGPQHQALWCDEVAAWADPQGTWDMAMMGLRLGARPRAMVTTTPRPIKLLRDLMGRADCVVTREGTYANRANLAPAFFASVISRYEGTRLGRQELDGEILDDMPGALWKRGVFDAHRLRPTDSLPEMSRIVVGVDPSGTSGDDDRDAVGIVVAGLGADGRGYVLSDMTSHEGPAGWAATVMRAYRAYGADAIVAEQNYGGAMCQATIQAADRNAPVKMVTATRGKSQRAEPIALLYEQGRVSHVGNLAPLEDELCQFLPGKYAGERSPNRADACIWALTELMLGGAPRISFTSL